MSIRTIQLLKYLVIVLAFSLAVVMAEFCLRSLGFRPHRKVFDYQPVGQMAVQMKDGFLHNEKIGWINQPGEHQRFSFGRTIRVSILPDHSRSSGPVAELVDSSPKIFFLGDSFTFGSGLNDSETFSWQVQRQLRGVSVKNFGTAGFSTCQSWLLLQELLEPSEIENSLVVYGLSAFHEARNIALPSADFAVAMSTGYGKSFYPVCRHSADMSSIVALSPREYENFPLAEQSGFVALLQRGYLQSWSLLLRPSSEAVTKSILLAMSDFVKKHKGKFVVFLQDMSEEDLVRYRTFFEEYQLLVLNGSSFSREEKYLFPDGHPNAELNALWGKEFVAWVRQTEEGNELFSH